MQHPVWGSHYLNHICRFFRQWFLWEVGIHHGNSVSLVQLRHLAGGNTTPSGFVTAAARQGGGRQKSCDASIVWSDLHLNLAKAELWPVTNFTFQQSTISMIFSFKRYLRHNITLATSFFFSNQKHRSFVLHPLLSFLPAASACPAQRPAAACWCRTAALQQSPCWAPPASCENAPAGRPPEAPGTKTKSVTVVCRYCAAQSCSSSPTRAIIHNNVSPWKKSCHHVATFRTNWNLLRSSLACTAMSLSSLSWSCSSFSSRRRALISWSRRSCCARLSCFSSALTLPPGNLPEKGSCMRWTSRS